MNTFVLAIANQKGGVGKTTTAINLSACLAERKRNVLVIDLDPQANATSGLGLQKSPGQSIYNALLGHASAMDYIQSTDMKRLDVIPAEVDLAGAEIDIARGENYLHRFKNTVMELIGAERYHYIVVDCPPSLGILTMNALVAAHAVVLPIQCEYYALEGLSVITDLVKKLNESGANPHLEIEGIVMTMYDLRTNLAQQVVQEVAVHFGDKVYETLIPRSVRLSEAPSFGKPIIAYDARCTGAVAYRQLAKEFLKRQKKKPPGPAEEPVADAPPPDEYGESPQGEADTHGPSEDWDSGHAFPNSDENPSDCSSENGPPFVD